MAHDVVVVTGAAGLLGSSICEAMKDSDRVVGLDVAEPDPPIDGVTYFEMDITKEKSVKAALSKVRDGFGERIASVIHLAAYYDFSGEPSALYDEVTVRGSERFLKALRKDFELEQFIFSSSMLVHAPTEPGDSISEEDPLEAQWDYPESKIAAEGAIRAVHGDTPVVFLRIAGVYTDDCDSLPLSQQIRRIAEDELTGHVFPGDTSHGQVYVHMDDLVCAVERTVARRGDLGAEETFLIGEAHTYSYDEVQKRLGELIHGEADWKTREISKAVAKSGAMAQSKIPGFADPFIKPWMIDLADDHYELDIAHARETLAWTPERDLLETLPNMVKALLRDPDAWYARHGFGSAPDSVQSLAHA